MGWRGLCAQSAMEARSITHRARGGSSPSAMHTPRQEDRGLLEASDVESPLTIPSDSDAALPRPSEVRGVLRVMDAAFGADAHVCAAAAPSGGERMGVLAASPASDRGWVARSWSALRDAAASVVRACVGALPERRRDRVAAAALVSVLSSVLLFVWLRRLRGRSAAPAVSDARGSRASAANIPGRELWLTMCALWRRVARADRLARATEGCVGAGHRLRCSAPVVGQPRARHNKQVGHAVLRHNRGPEEGRAQGSWVAHGVEATRRRRRRCGSARRVPARRPAAESC